MADLIATQIVEVLTRVYTREIHTIMGKHIQRDNVAGVFRFLPGRTRQTLLNDIGTFNEHFVACCRGIGVGAKVEETATKGVEVKLQTTVNTLLGKNLIDR